METIHVLLLVTGLVAAVFGALALFAGSMSDSPSAGSNRVRLGCWMITTGAAAIVIAVVWAVFAWLS